MLYKKVSLAVCRPGCTGFSPHFWDVDKLTAIYLHLCEYGSHKSLKFTLYYNSATPDY